MHHQDIPLIQQFLAERMPIDRNKRIIRFISNDGKTILLTDFQMDRLNIKTGRIRLAIVGSEPKKIVDLLNRWNSGSNWALRVSRIMRDIYYLGLGSTLKILRGQKISSSDPLKCTKSSLMFLFQTVLTEKRNKRQPEFRPFSKIKR